MKTKIRTTAWTVTAPEGFAAPVYLTDADCGFCQRWMGRAQRFMPNGLPAIAYWDAPLAELGLTMEACHRDGHMVTANEDGTVTVSPGVLSWAAALGTQRGVWKVLGWMMGHQPLHIMGDLVYRVIADNRAGIGAGNACSMTRSSRDGHHG